MRKLLSDLGIIGNSDVRWGLVGMAAAAVGLVVAGLIFIIPFGESTYTAYMKNSGQLRPGDEVRIAGVNVGKVRTVSLDGARVKARFTVDSGESLGDATSIEVKLLTPVGGHYLAVKPAGDRPLGDTPIPEHRASDSVELTQVMESAAPAFGAFDGSTLRQTILEVNRAIDGQPLAVRNLLTDATDLMTGLALQSDQLDTGRRVADEYIAAIANDKALLAEFVRHLGVVAVKLGKQRENIVTTFQSLRRLAEFVHRPIMAFGDHIEPSISNVEEAFRTLTADLSKIDKAIAGLTEAIQTLSRMLGFKGILFDQSRIVVRNSGLCVPGPGQRC
ncbi:Mce family protein [Gordonia araii NBRC 100433]|uniref:Mce family protein n=1 Tax=Gordonia araii NBRC 100433 TaxID=1073574 RepID=G7GXB2_9ACTN|nr:MlaD family protein [Gordonia araii]NNG99010.1 MCE family protein [Gordonia araii NBRC 100433]GAB08237.1 Mce family protein [Gordonia araii NBRC 100433]